MRRPYYLRAAVRRWIRTGLALVLAVAMTGFAAVGLLPEAASRAADSTPSLFAQASFHNGISVVINDLQPRILTTEEELVVSGTVTNTSDQVLTTPALFVSMESWTPVSVDALATMLNSPGATGVPVSINNLSQDLGVGASTPFEIHIPFSQLPLSLDSEWGPRVVTVSAHSSGSSGFDRSIAIWDSGEDLAGIEVSTLVAWTSENTTGTSAERLAVQRIAQMTGATLAMDSRVIPRAKVSDVSQEHSDGLNAQSLSREDQRFFSALFTTAPQVVALPDGDADLGALVLAGNESLLARAADSLASFPDRTVPAYEDDAASGQSAGGEQSGRAEQSQSDAQSADSQSGAQSANNPDQDAPSSPALLSATSTTQFLTDVVWPSADSFGTTQLAAHSDRVTIAPVGALQPDDDLDFTSLAIAEVSTSTGETSLEGESWDTATVLVQNDAIASLLGWSTSSRADALDAEQGLAALTAIITRERPYSLRTVFAAVPRTTTVTNGLTDRLTALLSQRWVTPVPLQDMMRSTPTDVERTIVEPGSLAEDSDRALTTLNDAFASVTPLARATSDPQAVLSDVEEGVLPTMSAAIKPDEQLTRASQFSASVSVLRQKVTVEPSAAVNLINKSAQFPVLVRNSLDWDITVSVTLNPSDPRLQAMNATTATIPAGAVTTVEVPVTAIGSGDIEVTYKVSTPDGTILDDSQRVLVRMRAGWEDAFTMAAAGIFGLLFIAGLTRTVRKRAGARRVLENP